MLAEEALRDGNVQEALDQLQQRVRSDPSNSKHRIFLFQLLAVMGAWDRALTQLNVLGDMDASALAMVQTYRETLQCEVLRAEIFSGQKSPMVFGEPEEWVALTMQALRMTAAGNHAQAKELRDRAFEQAPAKRGTIDEVPFEWIADADTRLGPILEAIVKGRYYWIPFHRIQEIRIEAPADLRDVVWTPANFAWANGGTAVGFIPTRYPTSESNGESAIQLARRTDWQETGSDGFIGLGQRMIATDAAEYPLMDVRVITLEGQGQAEGAA